jgi:hypothetical protein
MLCRLCFHSVHLPCRVLRRGRCPIAFERVTRVGRNASTWCTPLRFAAPSLRGRLFLSPHVLLVRPFASFRPLLTAESAPPPRVESTKFSPPACHQGSLARCYSLLRTVSDSSHRIGCRLGHPLATAYPLGTIQSLPGSSRQLSPEPVCPNADQLSSYRAPHSLRGCPPIVANLQFAFATFRGLHTGPPNPTSR